ncbi:MAG: hypothetical protein ACE5IQ_04255 [Candidatus Methylomirabilales bacterium]
MARRTEDLNLRRWEDPLRSLFTGCSPLTGTVALESVLVRRTRAEKAPPKGWSSPRVLWRRRPSGT